MSRTIYLDMDGVLADFDGAMALRGVGNSSGHFLHLPKAQWSAEQLAADAAVRAEMLKPGFWPSLPVMPGARELLAVASQLVSPDCLFILTATPRGDPAVRAAVAAQKTAWAADNLGFDHMRVLTCLRSEKRLHAGPGRILVDDLASNCAEWRAARGVAVQFTSAADAICGMMEHFCVTGY